MARYTYILLASYEVLLKSAIQESRTAVRGEKQEDFWTWIKELSSSSKTFQPGS